MKKHDKLIYRLFLSCFLLLCIGTAWIYTTKTTAFPALIYHPYLSFPIIQWVSGISYRELLQDVELNNVISSWIGYIGLLVGGIGLSTLWHRFLSSKLLHAALVLVGVILLIHAFSSYLDKGYRFGQFIEYSLQVGTPFFLWQYLKNNQQLSARLIFWIKIATALSFIGHGLFALGIHPVPGQFIDMMIKVFGITENTARLWLQIVGVLDILAAIGIFIPNHLVQRFSFFYIIIWGFLTACARIIANFYLGYGWYSIEPWIPEFLVRTPHFILPLCVYLNKEKSIKL